MFIERIFKSGSFAFMIMLLAFAGCAKSTATDKQGSRQESNESSKTTIVMADYGGQTGSEAKATFGGGCFWCVEAVFQQLDGVTKVESGYAGGKDPNPTYEEVTTGTTGHAEVVQITYDTEKLDFSDLLDVFFKTHNPTTLNRQGADVGTQYRSAVFYHNAEQKGIAEEYIKGLDASGAFGDPIVTKVEPLKNYSKAEDYHQDYYENNRNQPYCTYVIKPKLDKFQKEFKEKLKQ